MNLAQPILSRFQKKQAPKIEVGDVVRVHQKISEGGKERIQVFEGIVIACHEKSSLDATFTVRKIASGVGVERTYLVHSPNVVKIEFKRSSKVRRSKLYYLRSLVGKALRMKDKKGVVKENWELVAEDTAVAEPTEADIAEAVEAAEKAKQEEAQVAETEAPEDGKVEEVGGESAPSVEEGTKAEESNHDEQASDESATDQEQSNSDTEATNPDADSGSGTGDQEEPTA